MVVSQRLISSTLTNRGSERKVDGVDERRDHVVRHLRWQVDNTNCPITSGVLAAAADDVDADGPTWATLRPHAGLPGTDALGLRLAGAAHRAALRGAAPDYARHLPTCGGDGDVGAAVKAFLALLAGGTLDDDLRPVQTNEPGRLTALRPAFAAVRERLALPLRLLEVGTSAGLLLRGAGPAVERRGCDPDPLDPTAPDDRLLLLSFVWAGQVERFRRLEAALDAAAGDPVAVDRAEAGPWLREQLAAPRPGVATVVFHSVVWQYLSADGRAEAESVLRDAGGRATAEAPLAWLRFEPDDGLAGTRVTLWPGAADHLVATSGFHGQDLVWHGFPEDPIGQR